MIFIYSIYPYPYDEDAFKSCSEPASSASISRFPNADRCSIPTPGATGPIGESGRGNAAGMATAQAITANKSTSTYRNWQNVEIK